MITISDKNTQQVLGTISEDQLQYLIDQLEEEALEDQDYSVTPMLLDFFEGEGADLALVELLRKGLGDREEMNIVWSE